jgi:GDP-L-fucose synthase
MTTWLVAGATGLAGRAITEELENRNEKVIKVSSKNCDLTKFDEINEIIRTNKPNFVIDAAAKVGGIVANADFPVDFLEINALIQLNLFKACHINQVEKVVFLSSSCVYPRLCPQPIKESYLMTGELEKTNSAYAIAKIMGMRAIQAYREQFGYNWISVMPTNLFGKYDNFSLSSSHLLPALIRKFNDAKLQKLNHVTLWGTGTPKRELMYSTNFADALIYVAKNYNSIEPINIGTGIDHTIFQIAEMVKEVVNYDCEIKWDSSKPDGTPRKLLDITKLKNLDFDKTYDLKKEIHETNNWFIENYLNDPKSLKL